MIYGDQSQEGFLLRDYFCCDTNELRLQIHCRPITLEKRLLAYYAQIISEFYPPCYSLQHLILLCANVYFRAHMHVFVCPAFQMDSGLLSVKPCRPQWGAPGLLIYHCCIVLPEFFTQLYLLVRQYATYACVRL